MGLREEAMAAAAAEQALDARLARQRDEQRAADQQMLHELPGLLREHSIWPHPVYEQTSSYRSILRGLVNQYERAGEGWCVRVSLEMSVAEFAVTTDGRVGPSAHYCARGRKASSLPGSIPRAGTPREGPFVVCDTFSTGELNSDLRATLKRIAVTVVSGKPIQDIR